MMASCPPVPAVSDGRVAGAAGHRLSARDAGRDQCVKHLQRLSGFRGSVPNVAFEGVSLATNL